MREIMTLHEGYRVMQFGDAAEYHLPHSARGWVSKAIKKRRLHSLQSHKSFCTRNRQTEEPRGLLCTSIMRAIPYEQN